MQDRVQITLAGLCLTGEEIERYVTEADLLVEVSEVKAMGVSYSGLIQGERGWCCQRCHNENPERFVALEGAGRSYCLECLQLGRIDSETILYHFPWKSTNEPRRVQMTWEGTLSPEQARAASWLVESLKHPDQPSLVHAVTGAGKTEMIFEVIQEVLSQGGRVCLASPRVDVCIELAPRIQAAFAQESVMLLYGRRENPYRYADIVIATTHQLLRYREAFDLLIVDEVDAFPYVEDPMLHSAVEHARREKGKLIYLTATTNQALHTQIAQGDMAVITLPARYHRHPLPEPEFVWIGDWRQVIQRRNPYSKMYRKLQEFMNLSGKKLVFLANIDLAEQLYRWIQSQRPNLACDAVHAQDPKRQEKVQSLRDGSVELLFSTTILERGVTFEHCHVFILGAEHPLFTKSSLVQMSGRVGRKSEYPTGTLIYGHFGISHQMCLARDEICEMNRLARQRGLVDAS